MSGTPGMSDNSICGQHGKHIFSGMAESLQSVTLPGLLGGLVVKGLLDVEVSGILGKGGGGRGA